MSPDIWDRCTCGHRAADHQLSAPAGERGCVATVDDWSSSRYVQCPCADFQPAEVTR